MKTNPRNPLVQVAFLLLGIQLSTFAQGTAFTYQGRLNAFGAPANGTYDLVFAVYASANGTNDGFAVQTNAAVVLSNGLFTVTLAFPPNIFSGDDRWLDINVRTNGALTYSALSPRQKITATPYAFTAGNLTGSIGATQLNGTIPLAQLPAAVVTNNQSGVNFTGTFSGNGAGLTNILAFATNTWRLDGNAGTTPGTQFIGTTDNQPLELKVNGKRALRLEPSTNAPNVIGGSPFNFVGASVVGATIGGGGAMNYLGVPYTNWVLSDLAVVGGGLQNTIASASPYATIGGGIYGSIGTNSSAGTIAGGYQNDIAANSSHATIAGGLGNSIGSECYDSAIGGGEHNYIDTTSQFATIAGGLINIIGTNSNYSVIGGGDFNNIPNNSVAATIPGGERNFAANYAFAAGRRAKANHPGAFVWADSTDADFSSTGNNQFCIRAGGGVGINIAPAFPLDVQANQAVGRFTSTNAVNGSVLVLDNSTPSFNYYGAINFQGGSGQIGYVTNGHMTFRTGSFERMRIEGGGNVGIGTSFPTNKLHVAGGVSATAYVTTSDRNAKENLTPISSREILDKVAALPIWRWNYKAMNDGPHLGPMAQDFYAAFSLGGSDTTITTVDPDGVALAAIQGLNEKVESGKQQAEIKNQKSEERIQKLETENADIRKELDALKQVLAKLSATENSLIH